LSKKADRKKKPAVTVGRVSIEKDPRVYAERIQPVGAGLKRILGLDLGTNCGVAFADFVPGKPVVDVPLFLGQWDLSIGSYDSGILRLVRLKQFMAILNPDLVVYEEVKYAGTEEQYAGKGYAAIIARVSTSAEFLGALKATLGIWCVEHNVPAEGLGITKIKRYATGKGNASKVEMITAANEKLGTDLPTEDYEKTGVDNMCDAAFCCKIGLESYSEGIA
jgi:hypothetical protein